MITRGLCGYSGAMTSWFSVTVLVDGRHWSHRCLRRIYQFFDGVVPGGSPLRGWFQWSQFLVVCGTLKRLVPSAVLKLVCKTPTALSLSTMLGPQKVILCWNEVFLQCPPHMWLQTFRCVVYSNQTPQVKMSHSESILWRYRNPCLTLPVWSNA